MCVSVCVCIYTYVCICVYVCIYVCVHVCIHTCVYVCVSVCVCVCTLSPVWLFATLWTIACQAPLSMEFSRQEYWSTVAVSFSKGSSQPRDRTHGSGDSYIDKWVLYHWATWEVLSFTTCIQSAINFYQLKQNFHINNSWICSLWYFSIAIPDPDSHERVFRRNL